jgi:hypothetical protein
VAAYPTRASCGGALRGCRCDYGVSHTGVDVDGPGALPAQTRLKEMGVSTELRWFAKRKMTRRMRGNRGKVINVDHYWSRVSGENYLNSLLADASGALGEAQCSKRLVLLSHIGKTRTGPSIRFVLNAS